MNNPNVEGSGREDAYMNKGKVEVVAEEVDAVAEVVESVANAADKALKEVTEELPSNSKFKEAAEVMEHLCCVAAQSSEFYTHDTQWGFNMDA